MTDREKPDVTAAGLKLWRAAKDFGRALASDTEDVWRGATEATTKPARSIEFIEVPRVLVENIIISTGIGDSHLFNSAVRLKQWAEESGVVGS